MKNSESSREINEKQELKGEILLPEWFLSFLGVDVTANGGKIEEEINEGECFINKMPGPVFKRIFRFVWPIDLLRAEGVCRLWKRTLSEENCRKGAVKKLTYETITNGLFPRREITDKHMRNLFDRFGADVEEFELPSFLSYMEEDRYQYWNESSGNITSKIFNFIHLAPNLVKLDLCGCWENIPNEFVSCESFAQMANSLHRLKSIKFGYNVNDVSPDVLRTLLTACPLLTDFSAAQLNGAHLIVVAECCPQLESFKLISLSSSTDDGVNAFLRRLTSLKTFVWHDRIPNLDFERARFLGTLLYLEIREIIEPGLRAIVNGCPRLEKVVLKRTDLNDDMFQLLEHLPSLKKLYIDYSWWLTDDPLIAIARRGLLEELELTDCGGIHDDAIVNVLQFCKSLVKLNIFGCSSPWLTNDSLRAVVEEVERRHEVPPKEFPKNPHDPRIFYLTCGETQIAWDDAKNEAKKNAWLRVSYWP